MPLSVPLSCHWTRGSRSFWVLGRVRHPGPPGGHWMWPVSRDGGQGGTAQPPPGRGSGRGRQAPGDSPMASPSSLPLFLPACGLGSGGAGGTATLRSQALRSWHSTALFPQGHSRQLPPWTGGTWVSPGAPTLPPSWGLTWGSTSSQEPQARAEAGFPNKDVSGRSPGRAGTCAPSPEL